MKHFIPTLATRLCAAFVALLALSACNHKELCYDHTHTVTVKVVFDWQNAPSATPQTMSLYLFPSDGSEPVRYEFTDRNGGSIRVPFGTYDAVCLNSDTENIEYANTGAQSTFEVTTLTTTLLNSLSTLNVRSETAPRAAGTEEERVARTPDPLWTDHDEDIVLRLTEDEQTITLYPVQSYCNYTLEIRNAENLKYTYGLDGSLASMAGGWLPGLATLTTERVTLPLELVIEDDLATVTGAWTTFGHCPDTDATHSLIVYAVLSDGNKYSYTYDVTEQIHTAADPYNVHIVLDGLPLPKPIENGGGLHPSVDDWQSEEIDIEM